MKQRTRNKQERNELINNNKKQRKGNKVELK